MLDAPVIPSRVRSGHELSFDPGPKTNLGGLIILPYASGPTVGQDHAPDARPPGGSGRLLSLQAAPSPEFCSETALGGPGHHCTSQSRRSRCITVLYVLHHGYTLTCAESSNLPKAIDLEDRAFGAECSVQSVSCCLPAIIGFRHFIKRTTAVAFVQLSMSQKRSSIWQRHCALCVRNHYPMNQYDNIAIWIKRSVVAQAGAVSDSCEAR